MSEKIEDGAPQNPAPAVVTLTAEEIADLKHKADVSSQNFERAKIAEAKVAELKTQLQATPPAIDGEFSDEGKQLLGKISALEGIITGQAQKEAINTLQVKYPALKDKSAEFETFRNDPENAGMNVTTAAKAFLAENDLLVSTTPRRGLEKPAGSGRGPISDKLTADDVAELRITNYAKYSKMVREGKIDLN